MFLAKDGCERTVLHVTAEKGRIEILQKLWEWAKEVLKQEELNNMFLAKDKCERTAWHISREGPNRSITETVGLG